MMNKQIVKFVITGPVNAGKTTLIQHISDTAVISTDESATDAVAEVKKNTTVAMDHGILYVDSTLELHLYGTPGQRRFDFMWEILAVGASGIIFLVDGSDPTSIEEMKYIYKHFSEQLSVPALVGVTKQDVEGSLTPLEVSKSFGEDGVPVIGCDPRNKKDSKLLMLSLLSLIMQDEEEMAESEFF